MPSRFECPRCQTVFVKDIGGDAAFVECPSCGALALPAGDADDALSRALSGSQKLPHTLASTEAEERPEPVDPAAPAPGMFSALLAETPLLPEQGGPRDRPAPAKSELDFDLGDVDLELPELPPAAPTGRFSRTERASGSSEGPMNDGPFRGGDGSSLPGYAGPPVHAIPPEAMAALARDADAGPTVQAEGSPFPASLSEEAFGDLEKAFDEMALKPAPPPSRSALNASEQRFLQGETTAPPRPAPPRRPDRNTARTGRHAAEAPPQLPGRRAAKSSAPRARPTHLQLSEEARRLAFYSTTEMSSSQLRPRLEPSSSPRPAMAREEPTFGLDARARAALAAQPLDRDEDTDLVRTDKQPKRERRPVPSAFAGLSFLRVAAIVIGCTILGGVGGALSAPQPRPASTPRARAELRFAEGNRFYDEGRYDDALGSFRGALNIDPTFALAHRAKGASLAKLSRFDDAASAYEEYLKLEPAAVDAADVKAAIVRRGGSS